MIEMKPGGDRGRTALAIGLVLLLILLMGGGAAYLFRGVFLPGGPRTINVGTKAMVAAPVQEQRLELKALGLPSGTDKEFVVHVLDGGGHGAPAGVAGATVWLVKDSRQFPTARRDGSDRAVLVKTDANGEVKVKFAATPVNVVVIAEGFAPVLVRAVDLSKKQPYEVKLEAGKTVRGMVKDAKGPLAGVKVIGKRQQFVLEYMEPFQIKGTTDAAGSFALDHAAAGQYELTSEIPGAIEGMYTEWTPVEVKGSGDPPKVVLVATMGSVIKGKFIGDDGAALGGRKIYASTRLPRQTNQELTTKADGTFVITGIAAGASGGLYFQDGRDSFVHATDPQNKWKSQEQTNALNFRELALGTYVGIEVRVSKASHAKGTVLDEAGKPAKGAMIEVTSTHRLYTADAKGMYDAEIPTGEPVELKVYGYAGYEESAAATVTAQAGETVAKDFATKRLEPEVVDGFISGQVVDEAGNPVAKAQVEFGNESVLSTTAVQARNNNGAKKPTWTNGDFYPAQLTTDGQGKFKFDMLHKTGTADLWADGNHNQMGWEQAVTVGRADVRIVLHPRGSTIKLQGHVVDERGQGVKGKITLCSADNEKPGTLENTSTGADGAFTLEMKTPASVQTPFLRFVFVGDEGRIGWRTIPKCSGTLELALKPEAKVSGLVVDAQGAPIEGAKVRLYYGKDSTYGLLYFGNKMYKSLPAATTDKSGAFVLGGLPVDSAVSVMAERDGYQYEYVWNHKTKSTVLDLGKMVLKDGITVSGTVKHEDGTPAAGAVVAIGWVGDEKTTTADAQGVYRFVGMQQELFYNEPTALRVKVGEPLEWEGTGKCAGRLQPGDKASGVDLVVKRAMESKQREWQKTAGAAAESKYLAAIVDDADPQGGGKETYDDTVSEIDGQGHTRWQRGGMNVYVWLQGHGIAQNPVDHSLWLVGAQLTKLRSDGTVEFEKKDVRVNSLAVDPKTGNVWVVVNEGTAPGPRIVIYNLAGEKLKEVKIATFEIAYSAHDDCFWTASETLQKLNRDGKVMLEGEKHFDWLGAGLSVNESDGSVWAVDPNQQDSASSGQVIVFEPDGRVRRTIELAARGVAVDVARGHAWLSGTPDGLVEVTLNGDVVKSVPVASASVAVEPDTGCVWVAGNKGIWRVDANGNYLWGNADAGEGTGKWVTMVGQ